MNLRFRLSLYLTLVYLVLAGLLAYHFASSGPVPFLFTEAATLILFIFGYQLIRRVFQPIELLRESVRLLEEEDFTTRLRLLGHREMDRLIGVYNRMAEQLRSERIHTREQETFLNKILEATPTGIITLDYDDRIASINPSAERLLGVSAGACLDLPIAGLPSHHAEQLTSLEVGRSCLLMNNDRRRFRARAGRFIDRGFYKRFLFIDELTEELRLAEKLTYTQLIRVISHEINNSLGAANSLLQSCRTYTTQITPGDRDDYQMALNVVTDRIDHLQSFINAYARVVQLPEPVLSSTSLADLIERTELLMREASAVHGIQLSHRYLGDPPSVLMDMEQMEQALLNIVKNAVEAAGTGGHVITTAARDRGVAYLCVEDSGPGFPPDQLDRLFAPFQSTKPDGQGIGLTLVAEILNQHGFDFTMTNDPTRFTIWMHGSTAARRS